MFSWLSRSGGETREDLVRHVRVEQISPSPYQPRQSIDQAELADLAASIRRFGILQPILVRPRQDGYELVMGERRWRAAQEAGLDEVPVIIRELSDEDAALAALVENIQRSDLSFWEEAEGYARMLRTFNLTQEALALSLGRSQSSIANKLRLLKLPSEVRRQAQAAGIAERHARALLRLPDEVTQLYALAMIIESGMTAREAEEYVETLLNGAEAVTRENDTPSSPVEPIAPEGASDAAGSGQRAPSGKKGRTRKPTSLPVIKDLRIMINTFRQGIEALQRAGLDAEMHARDREDHLEIHIRIPKG